MSTEIAIPEKTAEIIQRAEALREKALSLRVTDEASYTQAGFAMTELVSAKKKAHELFDPFVADAHAAHKAATARRAAVIDPLEKGERYCRDARAEWTRQEEEKRRAKQRRLDAEAAEATRRAEQQKREEADRLAREAATLRAQAADLEEQGVSEEAKALAEQARETEEMSDAIAAEPVETIIAKAVPVNVPIQIQGVSQRRDWEVAIADADRVPREWCEPDLARIRAAVKSSKGALKIPGVTVKETTRESVRTLGRAGQ